jgi:hypothetical protein
VPSTAAAPAGRRPPDGEPGFAENDGGGPRGESGPSRARIAATAGSTASTPPATAIATPNGSAASSGSRSGGNAPGRPGTAMSIKGYPVAGSPAIARAATGSSPPVCPWPFTAATAGQHAARRWVATGRSWPSCVTGGPPSVTIAANFPLSGGTLLPSGLPDRPSHPFGSSRLLVSVFTGWNAGRWRRMVLARSGPLES